MRARGGDSGTVALQQQQLPIFVLSLSQSLSLSLSLSLSPAVRLFSTTQRGHTLEITGCGLNLNS